uniref:Uncharacterized protein n=1 Tax=Timema bartmani TaxID=61472 RepID=A0A7R9ELY6_9NEOP|nr:unnamed protein product [Timema bartmani]
MLTAGGGRHASSLKEGWLERRLGAGEPPVYVTRWFVLDHGVINAYRKPRKFFLVPLEVIPLNGAVAVNDLPTPREGRTSFAPPSCIFFLQYKNGRKITFRAPSVQERQEWQTAILRSSSSRLAYRHSATEHVYSSPMSNMSKSDPNMIIKTDYSKVRSQFRERLKSLVNSEENVLWAELPEVINSGVLANMDENQVKIEELKFQVITSEMTFNMELPELINLAKRSVSWDDPLPSFNRRIISVAVEKVKRCSDSLLGELELYWQQKLTLEGLYQIFLEHRQQLQAYIIYSSHLEELRTVFSSAVDRNSNLKVAVFSSKYKLERALLPLHRLQTIRCLLQQIRLVLDASSNNHVENFRCKRMLTDITQLVDESYKILMLQNGLEYVQRLEKLITTSVQPLNEHSCLSLNNITLFRSTSSNTLDSTLRSHKKVAEKEPEHFKTWSRTRCLNKLPPTPQRLTEQQTSIIPTATSRLQVQTMSTQGEVQQTSKIREVKHSAGLFQRLKRSTSISSTQSSTSSASFLTSDDNTSLQVISGARDLSLENVTSEKKIENIRTKMESDKNNITLEFSHMAHTKLRNSFFSFHHGDKIGDVNDDKALVSKFQAADLLSNRLGELSLKSTRQDSSNTRDSFSFNSQLKATQDSTLKLENHLSNSLKVSSQKQTAHFNSHSMSEDDHRFSESSMKTAYQFETKTVHAEHSSAQLTEEMRKGLFSNSTDDPSSLTIVELDSNENKQEESLHKEPPPEINHAINSLVLSLHKDTTFKPSTSSSPIITEVGDDETKEEHQEKEDSKQIFQTSLPLTNVSNTLPDESSLLSSAFRKSANYITQTNKKKNIKHSSSIFYCDLPGTNPTNENIINSVQNVDKDDTEPNKTENFYSKTYMPLWLANSSKDLDESGKDIIPYDNQRIKDISPIGIKDFLGKSDDEIYNDFNSVSNVHIAEHRQQYVFQSVNNNVLNSSNSGGGNSHVLHRLTSSPSLNITSNMSSIAHGDGYEEVNSSSASYQHMAHNTPNSSVSYTSATLVTQHKVSRCQIFRTSFEEAPLYQHYIFSSLSSQTSDDTSPIISEPSSEYGELENHIYEEISPVAPELPPRPNNMLTLSHPKRLGNQHIRWCESEDVINSGLLVRERESLKDLEKDRDILYSTIFWGIEIEREEAACQGQLFMSISLSVSNQRVKITGVLNNEPLMDGLTKKERLFQESKFEIVTSEVSYLKSLCILENVFVQSPVLSQLSVFSEENKTLLFSNVKMVKECSEHFVQALMAEWENDLKLGKMSDLLHQFATSEFKIYVDYCTNQVHIKRIILDLMEEDKTFAEALSKLEADPTCQNFSLISFLTLPIQRVTRFALLVDGVMKYVPDTDQSLQQWKNTIAVLREV